MRYTRFQPPATTQPLPPPPQSAIHYQQSVPGVWAVPTMVLPAIFTGEGIRSYVLITDAARSSFAVVVLGLVLAISVGVMVCGQLINRRDGRGR
ncbi:hypothetical protein K1T35_48045 (plasmid) [Pseudonocardia sp. DSM 110487]|uniref:hypothetical protein n=1 Tax=Pseudonocardia sp. DSM 110487 TaxID=2865833 RepID=UPI001C69FDE7|nr:hypothetical protein [Pseudonocardia sp. DSM 110487]QYN41102.1 hypothetical protein K1T35_48045 [Pseudonocardia sp. DSM 110487]